MKKSSFVSTFVELAKVPFADIDAWKKLASLVHNCNRMDYLQACSKHPEMRDHSHSESHNKEFAWSILQEQIAEVFADWMLEALKKDLTSRQDFNDYRILVAKYVCSRESLECLGIRLSRGTFKEIAKRIKSDHFSLFCRLIALSRLQPQRLAEYALLETVMPDPFK